MLAKNVNNGMGLDEGVLGDFDGLTRSICIEIKVAGTSDE
jgi:hypothetical protein